MSTATIDRRQTAVNCDEQSYSRWTANGRPTKDERMDDEGRGQRAILDAMSRRRRVQRVRRRNAVPWDVLVW